MNDSSAPTILSAHRASVLKNGYGGKADGLLWLMDHEIEVPPFYIITGEILQKVNADHVDLQDLLSDWILANNIRHDQRWAVRSSADVEDGKEKSFAGLFHSEIDCGTHDLADAIGKVIDAFGKAFALEYNSTHTSQYNIIIQEMVYPGYSGVLFSVNPLQPDDGCCSLDLIPGLGIKLVSGEETGMHALIRNGKATIGASENVYRGVRSPSNDAIVECSASDLQQIIRNNSAKLESIARRLQDAKGFPVDIEFAICGDKIILLQVRPVTNVQLYKGERTVWDNSNISSNYPGLSSPLTISFVVHSYNAAYTTMCRFLGGSGKFIRKNEFLFSHMTGGIRGALYYNLTAWQQLLYQMPFGKRTSRMIAKVWGAEPAEFTVPKSRLSFVAYPRLLWNLLSALVLFRKHKRAYLRAFEKISADFSRANLKDKSYDELASYHAKLEHDLTSAWIAPMLNGFYTMVLFNRLKKTVSRSRLSKEFPNFVNDILFSTGDVISVKIIREFRSLVDAIRKEPGLCNRFETETPTVLLDSIRQHYPAFAKQFDNYIAQYGERSEDGELKMETVNYQDDPALLLALLKNHLSAGNTEQNKTLAFDYRAVLKKQYPYNLIRRVTLIWLIRATINRVRDRENFRFIRTRSFSMVRRMFRFMEKQLVHSGHLDAASDVFYLMYEDLTHPELKESFRAKVQENKKLYATYSVNDLPIRWHEYENGMVAVQQEAATGDLKGIGCCSGIFSGEVVLVDEHNLKTVQPEGKILLAQNFEPGWIGLFARAGGLISERGSLLSHTAILCREMGTPSIVGAKGAIHKLKNARAVKMNGATGNIEILEYR